MAGASPTVEMSQQYYQEFLERFADAPEVGRARNGYVGVKQALARQTA